MANEKRVRADYVFGKIDAAIDTAATTLSSPALSRLPVIDTTSHAALTIGDPTTGNYEIVHAISHAASATTATVQRAREGSTARAWAIDSKWSHAPTVADFALNKDRRWLPGSAEAIIDEFSDSSLHSDWVRVDPGAATRQKWTEGADCLSVAQLGGDAAAEIHGLVRPASALAVGDAFVTRLTVYGPWAENYVMGGLVLSDGTATTSNIVFALVFADASGMPTIRVQGGTFAGATATTSTAFRASSLSLFVRLVLVSADTWRADTSPDGVSWRIGTTLAQAITPTHVGFLNSSWSSAVTGVVSYEFLRRVSGIS